MTTKSELLGKMAVAADITKGQAELAYDALFDSLRADLKANGSASISGFGTFRITKRAARTGRNPQTGATLKIKASKSVGFKAAKGLKEFAQKTKV